MVYKFKWRNERGPALPIGGGVVPCERAARKAARSKLDQPDYDLERSRDQRKEPIGRIESLRRNERCAGTPRFSGLSTTKH